VSVYYIGPWYKWLKINLNNFKVLCIENDNLNYRGMFEVSTTFEIKQINKNRL